MSIVFKARPSDPRTYRAAIDEGFTDLQARIISSRLKADDAGISGSIRPRQEHIDGPDLLPDIDKAATCIAEAIEAGRPIAVITDHDADGATSHAIIRSLLQDWGVSRSLIRGFISHRMREGYGVSHALLDRILPDLEPGTCVITADQGSADEPRIARLQAAGHTVIVTDHHGVPDEGPPSSAHAVVNPVRDDSKFPDRAIAGCHTALLVMASVRERLLARGVITKLAEKASSYLDYCAVGTIADTSSLGVSRNNRAIVQRGLRAMSADNRPCWRALRQILRKEGDWTAADVGYQIAARINARGRLGDAMLSVEFLCAEDDESALVMAMELDGYNRERRLVERANTSIAVGLASAEVAVERYGLCLWLGEGGHSGVHGISASRIVEKFGRPTICLSPIDDELATGSIRSTPIVNVKEVLSAIHREQGDLLISFGGHQGAGGLRIRQSEIPRLAEAWDRHVRAIYGDGAPEPTLLVDGDLDEPTLSHVDELEALEPYGRGFEAAVFLGPWLVKRVRPIGDGSHLKLVLCRRGVDYDAVWFSAMAPDGPLPCQSGELVEFAYGLDRQSFRGAESLQLIVRAMSVSV